MTNLCGLLIQDGNKKDAKKLYEDYLHKNGGEQMGDKVAYIDSLLNISICVRETPEEQQAVDHAIEAI